MVTYITTKFYKPVFTGSARIHFSCFYTATYFCMAANMQSDIAFTCYTQAKKR